MARHNIFGKLGEDAASDYLITNGYIIRERNWRLEHLEVDIIAEKNCKIFIIEVKTRKMDVSTAFKAIDNKKQSQLIKAANAYVKGLDRDYNVQIDVICIVGDNPENFKIEHIEDAVRPRLRTARGKRYH